jgi:hypothetical protein
MMEPEPTAAPEDESGAPEAQEQATPPVAPAPAAPTAESEPHPAPDAPMVSDPPPPPDTPRWMETPPPTPAPAVPVEPVSESAPLPPVEPAPAVPAVEAVPASVVEPASLEAAPVAPEAPVPPPVFQADPEPPAPTFAPEPPAPVVFESAPAVEEAPAAPPAFAVEPVPPTPVFEAPTPPAPEPVPPAPVVDPAFARAQKAASPAPGVPDQGWGVAQAPSFTPEAVPSEAQGVPASFGDPAPVPPAPDAPAEIDSQAFATELDPMAEPEPELSAAPVEQLATVIPIDVDGKWAAGGRSRMGGKARAPGDPAEKKAKGLRLKRAKGDAGLEVVPPGPASPEFSDVPVPPVPMEGPVDEPAPAKRKRGLGKEIRFGRKKKKEEFPAPAGGFDTVPVPPAGPADDAGFGGAPVPPIAPVADAAIGFGDVAPPPPPPPVAPPPPGGSNAGFGTDSGFGSNSGFGTDSGFGGQPGFGPPPGAEGWSEPIPEKKRRLRLPSSSRGGDSSKKMWSIVLVVVLTAAAVGFFFTRGGGSVQPAYALDFAAGQTYTYKANIAMNAKVSALGHTVPVDEQMTAAMTWNVQSVDASGTATVEVQLSDLQATVNGQSLPPGHIPDSALHSTMRIAKDGSIVSGSGFGSIAGGSSAATGNVPGTDQLGPLLPGHDVHPGDTWAKTYDSDLPYGMGHVHYKTHSVYVRNEDVNDVSAAVIQTKVSVPLNMKMNLEQVLQQSGTASDLPAGAHPVVTYRGHVGGTSTGWFDANSRQLLKTSVDMTFDFTMVFHGMSGGSVPNGTAMSMHGAMLINLQKV